MSNIVLGGIMGLAVADALGVPVEFQTREELAENPVIGMRSFGTYNQPMGTWSDDTSMTLALVDSLLEGLDYEDMMDKFLDWFHEGAYTPHGESFGIGNTTRESLIRYKKGIPALEAGGQSERDNGNGSLMRILPLVFYLESLYGSDFKDKNEAFDTIHKVSSLTHGHKRSLIACGIYISIAANIITDSLESGIKSGIDSAMDYYRRREDFQSELEHFARLEDRNFKNLPEEEIKSGGYVVDTLEAAIWCLLNTDDYQSAVLKAVNLASDTDTVAAVAGGLAGLFYGYEAIPREWRESIVKREYIEGLSNSYYNRLTKRSRKLL